MQVFSKPGDTALVLLVPETEAAVRPWRLAHDPSAAEGMPAHITVVYPFLAEDALNDGVLSDLSAACLDLPSVDLRLDDFGVFPFPAEGSPRVLWLRPGSSTCLDVITHIRARWPGSQAPGPVVPHLTITDRADQTVMMQAQAAVAIHLPIVAKVTSIALMAFDGTTWVCRQQFHLDGRFGTNSPVRVGEPD